MALNDLLSLSEQKNKKIGISEERIEVIKPVLRNYFAFWREYPDLMIDFMQTGGDPEKEKELTFHLYFYQRVFLRVAMRYKYVYAVFPRAYSKSFLSVLILMIRAILYPGAKLFSTAGGKEQASQILQEKVADICQKIPAFSREIDWRRGQTTVSKDQCRYIFKNGSTVENLAARESSRGRRFHAKNFYENWAFLFIYYIYIFLCLQNTKNIEGEYKYDCLYLSFYKLDKSKKIYW